MKIAYFDSSNMDEARFFRAGDFYFVATSIVDRKSGESIAKSPHFLGFVTDAGDLQVTLPREAALKIEEIRSVERMREQTGSLQPIVTASPVSASDIPPKLKNVSIGIFMAAETVTARSLNENGASYPDKLKPRGQVLNRTP